MKKLISILLAILLLMSILPMAAFAEEDVSTDTIGFVDSLTATSENGFFTLTADAIDHQDGWNGGGRYTLTIRAKNEAIIIKSIEAEIGFYYQYYDKVGVSGTAVKEDTPSKNHETVTVSNINSSEFSFTGGDDFALFKNITIHFCIAAHKHSYVPTTVYVCDICGTEAPEDYVPEVSGGNTASTLSEGNVTVLCSVGCLAIGFLVAMFIFKKKPATVSSNEK